MNIRSKDRLNIKTSNRCRPIDKGKIRRRAELGWVGFGFGFDRGRLGDEGGSWIGMLWGVLFRFCVL